MNSINLNSSSNFAYRPVKQEVMVNCSPPPNEACTNSRIRVYCTKGTQSVPIPYVVQWKRVNGGIQQSLDNNQGSCYECSPLDVGAIIEARIKYEDEGHKYETTRRFGPIRMDAELSAFERSSRHQSFRIKVVLQNTIVDLNLNFADDCIVLASREALEYRIKLTPTLEISLKPDTRLIYWKIKLHQEALTGYFSTMLRKSIKQKIQALEIIFESRQKRDIFLLLLRNFSRRKSSSKGKSNFLTVKEEPASMGYNRERELNLSAQESKSRKNSDNAAVPQSKRQRLPVEKDKLIIKERLPITKGPIENSQTSNNNISASLKADCLNVFDEEDANFIRQFQSKDTSTNLPSRRQHALNLRQSFVELQQKHMNTKSRKDLKIPETEDNSKQIKELRQQLEEARNQIIKLHRQISELREDNLSLKQMLNSSGNTKDVIQLRQKIQYLSTDNQRLESERTQIIADKIATQRKYQKEKQQKEVFKSKLIGIGVNINALFSNNKQQISVPNPFKEGIDRKDSRSPIQAIDPTKIEASRSNKQIKHRKDSNAKTSIGLSNYSPESPSHMWQPLARRVESEQQPSSYYG